MPILGNEHGLVALGFNLSYLPGRVTVKEVEPGSWAGQVGLQPGDILIAVNDFMVPDLSYSELNVVTRKRPLKMLINPAKGGQSLQCIVNTMTGFTGMGDRRSLDATLSSTAASTDGFDAARRLVPFQLRSMETGRRHPLRAVTKVGRSMKQVNPDLDLVVSGMSVDVSRVHCYIKCEETADPNKWEVRVFDLKGGGGHGHGPGGGYGDGAGTTVDNVPVDPYEGALVEPGSVLRFGVNELWVLEQTSLFPRSMLAPKATLTAQSAALQDPLNVRMMTVDSANALHTFSRCNSWIAVVRVVLDWLDQPDEPPCADSIEVIDERHEVISSFAASTLEEMEAFDVKQILEEVKFGRSLRVTLLSDPSVLALLLDHLAQQRSQLERELERRPQLL